MNVHPNATTDTLDATDDLEATGIMDSSTGPNTAPREIRADRLHFHRVHPEEVEFDRLHALFADAEESDEVFAQCGWDAHESEAETRDYLDERAAEWERGERYEYLLESISDNEYVGTTCLEVGDDGTGEFGLWLRKPYWGRELGSEVTDALVHVAVECLGAPFVTIGCRSTNDRSRRAIEKFVRRYGGAYYGSAPTVGSESENDDSRSIVAHHEWVVTREQFRSGERGISSFVPGVAYDEVEF